MCNSVSDIHTTLGKFAVCILFRFSWHVECAYVGFSIELHAAKRRRRNCDAVRILREKFYCFHIAKSQITVIIYGANELKKTTTTYA